MPFLTFLVLLPPMCFNIANSCLHLCPSRCISWTPSRQPPDIEEVAKADLRGLIVGSNVEQVLICALDSSALPRLKENQLSLTPLSTGLQVQKIATEVDFKAVDTV